jgi:adenylate kinase
MSEHQHRGGFLFDGFPRTRPQAEALTRLMSELQLTLDAVIVLDVDDDLIVRRLGGRLECPTCGAVYNRDSDPPRSAGRCDVCGSTLVQRADDAEETVRRRLEVYRQQTRPLIAYYRSTRIPMHTVDGNARMQEVQSRLVSLLER